MPGKFCRFLLSSLVAVITGKLGLRPLWSGLYQLLGIPNHFLKWWWYRLKFSTLYESLSCTILNFFTDVIDVKWYLVFLDCISPNYGCSGNFFTCVWAIYIPSSVKCLFMAFAHFCSELFVFVSYWIIGILYIFLLLIFCLL